MCSLCHAKYGQRNTTQKEEEVDLSCEQCFESCNEFRCCKCHQCDVGLSPPYHLFGGTQLNQRVIIEEELVAGNLPTSRSLSVIPESQLFTSLFSYLLHTAFFHWSCPKKYGNFGEDRLPWTNGPMDKKLLRPYEKKNTLEHWNIGTFEHLTFD